MSTILLVDADSLVYRVAANSTETTLAGQQNILDEAIEIMAERTEATDAVFLLTGRGCFRKDIPVPKVLKDGTVEYVEYKGNRKDTVPPATLNDLRAYLTTTYTDTRIFYKVEADDAMSYVMSCLDSYQKTKVIMAGIDKDLLQIPGTHFNWVKNEFNLVFPRDAELFLKKQLLCGDRTDNVHGLPGIGEVKAGKLLAENPNLDVAAFYAPYFKMSCRYMTQYYRNRSLLELLTKHNLDTNLSPYLSRVELDRVLNDFHELWCLLLKKIQGIGRLPPKIVDQDPTLTMDLSTELLTFLQVNPT